MGPAGMPNEVQSMLASLLLSKIIFLEVLQPPIVKNCIDIVVHDNV